MTIVTHCKEALASLCRSRSRPHSSMSPPIVSDERFVVQDVVSGVVAVSSEQHPYEEYPAIDGKISSSSDSCSDSGSSDVEWDKEAAIYLSDKTPFTAFKRRCQDEISKARTPASWDVISTIQFSRAIIFRCVDSVISSNRRRCQKLPDDCDDVGDSDDDDETNGADNNDDEVRREDWIICKYLPRLVDSLLKSKWNPGNYDVISWISSFLTDIVSSITPLLNVPETEFVNLGINPELYNNPWNCGDVLVQSSSLNDGTCGLSNDTFLLTILQVIGILLSDDLFPFYNNHGCDESFSRSEACRLRSSVGEEDVSDRNDQFNRKFCRISPSQWSSLYLLDNIDAFGSRGGFLFILRRIVVTRTPDKGSDKTSEQSKAPLSRYRLSPVSILQCLSIIQRCHSLLVPTVVSNYVPVLVREVMNSVLNLPASDLRHLTKPVVTQLTDGLNSLCKMSQSFYPPVDQFIGVFCLDVALLCFRCPSLEKQLHGLSYIKDSIQQFMKTERSTDSWMSASFLCEWLSNNRVFESMFFLSAHEQVARRAGDVIKFLANNNYLSDAQVDLIIGSASSRHPTFSAVVLGVCSECVDWLSFAHRLRLALWLQTIEFDKITEPMLELAKDLLVSCTCNDYVDAGVSRSSIIDSSLSFFWKVVTSSGVSQSVSVTSRRLVLHVLKISVYASHIQTWLDRCSLALKDWSDSESITDDNNGNMYSILLLLEELLWTVPRSSEDPGNSTTDNVPLSSFVYRSLISYKLKVIKTVEADRRSSLCTPPESFTPSLSEALSECQILPGCSHIPTISSHLNCLKLSLRVSGVSLGDSECDGLWNSLYLEALCFEEQAVLLKWWQAGVDMREEQRQISNQIEFCQAAPLLSTSAISCVFQHICGVSPSIMSFNTFKCFQHMFLISNIRCSAITVGFSSTLDINGGASSRDTRLIRVVPVNEICKLDVLNDIVFCSMDVGVVEESRKLLFSLYLFEDKASHKHFDNIMAQRRAAFVEEAMRRLSLYANIDPSKSKKLSNSVLVARCLDIVLWFLEACDQQDRKRFDPLRCHPLLQSHAQLTSTAHNDNESVVTAVTNLKLNSKTSMDVGQVNITIVGDGFEGDVGLPKVLKFKRSLAISELRRAIFQLFVMSHDPNIDYSHTISLSLHGSELYIDEDDRCIGSVIGSMTSETIVATNRPCTIRALVMSDHEASLHPAYLLANTQSYFNYLFSVLSIDGSEWDGAKKRTWRLLLRLPTNAEIKYRILGLLSSDTEETSQQHVEESWRYILRPASASQLLYSLHILDRLVLEGEPVSGYLVSTIESMYRSRFLLNGGFAALVSCLLDIQFDPSNVAADLGKESIVNSDWSKGVTAACVARLLRMTSLFVLSAIALTNEVTSHHAIHWLAHLCGSVTNRNIVDKKIDDSSTFEFSVLMWYKSLSIGHEASVLGCLSNTSVILSSFLSFILSVSDLDAISRQDNDISDLGEDSGTVKNIHDSLSSACIEICRAVFSLLVILLLTDHHLLSSVSCKQNGEAEQLEELFVYLILRTHSKIVRHEAVYAVSYLCRNWSVIDASESGEGSAISSNNLSPLKSVVFKVIDSLLNNPAELPDGDWAAAFSLLTDLVPLTLTSVGTQYGESQSVPVSLYHRIVHVVVTKNMVETSAKGEGNKFLCGLLQLAVLLNNHLCEVLRNVVDVDDAFVDTNRLFCGIQEVNSSLFEFLLTSALFEPNDSYGYAIATNNSPFPLCKAAATREAAYNLILSLCHFDDLIYIKLKLANFNGKSQKLISLLASMHSGIVPSGEEGDGTEIRSEAGYVGLVNPGCICYMTSLLQQLFMIPSLANGVMTAPYPAPFHFSVMEKENLTLNDISKDSVLYQLQRMFVHLAMSQRQAYDPTPFTAAYKDPSGVPTNIYQQMDTDEFFNGLVDKVEIETKGTNASRVLSSVVGGRVVEQLLSRECGHGREKVTDFNTVALDIVGRESILESLADYVREEILDGDNKVDCAECNERKATVKRTVFSDLPPTLVLFLKRFALNYDTFEKEKVNSYLKFPEILDMKPYTKEGLSESDGNCNETCEHGNNTDSCWIPLCQRSSSYYNYRLSGVVVHTGTADSGHYYSYVRERDSDNGQGRWIEFNDRTVSLFNFASLSDECFGGKEDVLRMDGMTKKQKKVTIDKTRNAYVLLYDRIDSPSTTLNIKSSAFSPLPSLSALIMNVNLDNRALMTACRSWTKEHLSFLNNVFNLSDGGCDSEGNDLGLLLTVMGAGVLATLLAPACGRGAQRGDALSLLTACAPLAWTSKLLKIVENSISGQQWLMNRCGEGSTYFRSILLECGNVGIRKLWVEIMATCIWSARRQEISDGIYLRVVDNDGHSNVRSVMLCLLGLLDVVSLSWRYFAEYWLLLKEFARGGHTERAFLVERGCIHRSLDLYLADSSPIKNQFPNAQRVAWTDRLAPPSLMYFFDFVALLVCSCHNEKSMLAQSLFPPTALDPEQLIPISDIDRQVILQKQLYTNGLSDHNNAPGLINILCHWSFEWWGYSNSAMEVALEGIQRHINDNLVFSAHFRLLSALLRLEDSCMNQRVDRAMDEKYANSIPSIIRGNQHRHHEATRQIIINTMFIVRDNNYVKSYLRQRKNEWRWVYEWLLSGVESEGYNGDSFGVSGNRGDVTSFRRCLVAFNEAFDDEEP